MQRVFGPYRILAELSRGGMGIVYRAVRETPPGREVALKVLAGRDVPETARTRFRREGEALARLRHPGIVGVHEVGEVGGVPFLALELIPGQTLRERVETAGPLSPAVAAALAAGLADAVGAMHAQGILHRDLKPSNVILDPEGRARLIDFGIVYEVASRETRLTQSGALVGTPEFLAPEQAQGRRDLLGPPTDVYGIGGVLYFALTGRPPHTAEHLPGLLLAVESGRVTSVRELRPDVPPGLARVCMRALARDPRQRYPDCAALTAALAEADGGPAPGRWVPLALALAVAGLVGLGAALLARDDASTPPSAPVPAPAPSPPVDSAPEPAPEPEALDPPPGVDPALDAERCEALAAQVEAARARGDAAAEERIATRLVTFARALSGDGLTFTSSTFAAQQRAFRAAVVGVAACARLQHARGESRAALATLELVPKLGGLPWEILELQVLVLAALGEHAQAHPLARDYLMRQNSSVGDDVTSLRVAVETVLRAADLEPLREEHLRRLLSHPDPDARRLGAWVLRLREAPPSDPGLLALAHQDPDAAEASFRARLRRPPLVADLGLAAVARERHAWEAVLEHTARVLEQAPTSPEAWGLRAEALAALDLLPDAARAASRSLVPGEPDAGWAVPVEPHVVRALACRRLGLWPQAVADGTWIQAQDARRAPWVEAEVFAPTRARAEALRAQAPRAPSLLFERLELQLALPELDLPWADDLERLRDHGADARRRGAVLGTVLAQFDATAETLADPSASLGQRATCLLFLGRYEEAWTLWERERRALAAADDRRECEPLLGQAEADVALGLRPEHVEQVQRAIDRAYAFPLAVAYKGELLRRLGRYEEAVATCSAALQKKPVAGFAGTARFPLLDRALALEALGRTEEALRDARQLLTLDRFRQLEGAELLRRLQDR
ncbi:MAG: serine/threonine-protein kinase [Planctomycetota bacterium]